MQISRVQLADLVVLGKRADWPRIEVSEVPAPRENEYVLVWRAADPALPERLIVPTDLHDFFAWSTTYLGHLAPLSACMQVTSNRDGPGRIAPFPRRALGVIFAEVAAGELADKRARTPGVLDFFSTLTFALAQGRCFERPISIDRIATRWIDARRLLRAPHPMFSVDHLLEVWSSAMDEQGTSTERQGLLFPEEHLTAPSAIRVADLGPQASNLPSALDRGPMEDRVRAFKEFAADVHRPNDSRHAMLLGGALSLVSGGTFRHKAMLGPAATRDVRPLLWYGWFEALAAEKQGSPWFGGFLGLRLRHEIARNWNADSSSADVDVAFEELEVMARQERSHVDVAPKHPTSIRVQLFEGVVTEVPTPRQRR